MGRDIKSLYGIDINQKWHTPFIFDYLGFGSNKSLKSIQEPRINELAKRVDPRGKRILEIGCLEGLHSLILHELGAKEIISIEARKESFLRCLILKNAFNLKNCTFLLGDVKVVLPQLEGHFDLCLAVGILYHLSDPFSAVFKIAELADSVFVWTHYVDSDDVQGQISTIQYKQHNYSGRYVSEDTSHYLSGIENQSLWLTQGSLFDLFGNAGFKNIDLIYKEDHEHGPAIAFLASKKESF